MGPARCRPSGQARDDVHRRRHHVDAVAGAPGPGAPRQPGRLARRRRPEAHRAPAATVRQPGHRRVHRREEWSVLLLGLLRRTGIQCRSCDGWRRARDHARGASRRSAPLGRDRQPLGAVGGPGALRAARESGPGPRPLGHLQLPPAARGRPQRPAHRRSGRGAGRTLLRGS